MLAGDLRSRIGFHKRVDLTDGYGNTKGGYSATPEFTVAGNVKPRLGGEKVLADRLAGTNLVNITVRRSSLTILIDEDWIAHDVRKDVYYNIRSIIDPNEGTVEKDRWVELLCERGATIGPIIA